jgi:hypothetical protein
MKIRMFPWSCLLRLLAAILFLSVLLNFDYPARHLFSWRFLLPSIDVWMLLGIMAVAAYAGTRALVWTSWSISALFLVLRTIRIGDTAVPMYLNRPFNLYIDSGYLFSIYDLLKTSSRHEDFLLMSAVVLLVVSGVVASSCCAWRIASKALSDSRIRIAFLGGSGIILGSVLISGWHATRPPAVVRLGQELLLTQRRYEQERTFAARLEGAARERAEGPTALKGLQGADVLLFIIESYGRTVFTRPQYRPAMTAIMDTFTRRLDQHGFLAVSSYLASPTYGGISRLAHATLESGLRVSNDVEDTALLRSSLPPLASYFRISGYRTVSVMPGTRFAFPQGAYFGYDRAYYAAQFNYHGPTFGWAPMPDQFVLDWVRRREFMQHDKPLFVRYVLISSHASFNFQPPYIPDWEVIGDGSIYHDRPPIYFPIHWPHLENAGDAYLHSLNYDFETLGGYLAKYIAADTLIIIMGDHQPNPQLTEPGEPWSVPVHVISRNPRLLDPFRKRGYTPGLIPAQPLPHAGMETFLPDFLQDFR